MNWAGNMFAMRRTQDGLWMATHHRQALILVCVAGALISGVVYDTLAIIPYDSLRAVLAGIVVLCLGSTFLLQRYPPEIIQPLIVAAWPLHLFTIGFFVSVFVVHGGAQAGQLLAYCLVAYATFLMLPVLLLLDRWLFDSLVRLVAGLSAILAIPSALGAAGVAAIGPIRLSNKPSYSEFSGIIASGGVFEHAEGHAMQMAIGLFCCLYALRKWPSLLHGLCLLIVVAGLFVSQGRGAIFGVLIACVFMFLPELFRRSRPVFFTTLILFWVFPFFIWPQLANIPGIANYLRMERGLSGRDVAWQFAYSLIEEKPLQGHGFLTSGELTEKHKKLLRKSGYSGAGTTFHNTFISKAVELGVIVTAFYTLLYLIPLSRICAPTMYIEEQQLIRNILLATMTASLFRDYNIGGVRSTALLVSVFFGLANLWPWLERWQHDGWDAERL